MRDIVAEICEITPKNYYNWKNKSHSKLVRLIEKYFTEDNLKEFIRYETISKLERLEQTNLLEIQLQNLFYENFTISSFDFQQFCFNFVEEIETNENNIRIKLYEYIIEKQYEIEEEVAADIYYIEHPNETPPSSAVLLSYLFIALSKFSNIELNFFVSMNYLYEPFRDNR